MSERSKAILNLIINCAGALVAGAMTAVSTADGPNAFKRPFVIISMLAALLPVLRAAVNENPKSGAKLDEIKRLAGN